MIEELTDLDKRNIIDAVSQQIHFHAITIKGVLEWVRLSGKAGDAGIHARHLPKIIEACSKNRELKEEILAIRADNEKMKDELCRLYQERDWDKGTMWSAGNE